MSVLEIILSVRKLFSGFAGTGHIASLSITLSSKGSIIFQEETSRVDVEIVGGKLLMSIRIKK